MKDWLNIADIIVIFLAIVFVTLDMVMSDDTLDDVFKLRGLFRLLRIILLIRKFDAIKK